MKEKHCFGRMLHPLPLLLGVLEEYMTEMWLKMTDHEIMISAGLYEKNLVTGEKGYNLAAIMLFGFLFTEIFPVLIQQNSLLKRTG